MPLAHGPYIGVCRGGPWDGKYMDHDRSEYRVPMLPPLSFRRASEAPDPPTNITLKWGTYRHVAGQWVWRDDENQERRR